MKCLNCGQEIPGGIYCPFCGTKLNNETRENIGKVDEVTEKQDETKETKIKKNKGLIFAGAAVIVLIVVIVLLLVFRNNPVTKFKSLIDSGDYAKANSIYESKISGNIDSESDIFDYLSEILNNSWNAYLNGDVNSDELNKTIEKLKKIEAGDEIKAEIEKIEKSYQTIKDSEKSFESGQNKQADGEFVDAIAEYQKVSKEDTFHYDDAQKAIEETKEAYRESILTYIEDFKTSKDYEAALTLIDEGLKVLVDDEILMNARNEVSALKEEQKVQDLLGTVEELRNKGEIKQVLKEINTYKGNDAKVIAIKAQVESEYETFVDNSVKELIKAKDVDAAKKMINDSKSLCPSSEIIGEWASKIDEYYPISLLDLNQFTTEKDPGNFYFKDNWVAGKDHDNMGNTDYVGLVYEVWQKKATGAKITYLIDGKYDTLSGIWAIKDVSKDKVEEKHRATISVYGDGACLYTSPIIRGGVQPIEFEVDISGVNELVIRIDATGDLHFALLNPELMKSVE